MLATFSTLVSGSLLVPLLSLTVSPDGRDASPPPPRAGTPIAGGLEAIGLGHLAPELAGLDAAALAGVAIDAAAPGHRRTCRRIALIALRAALDEVRADYLFAVAKCINGGDRHKECVKELGREYRAARRLSFAQYRERLAVCKLLDEDRYDPDYEPDDFTSKVTNRWFPLVVDRTLVYRKKTDEGIETIRVTTLRRTVEIEGVECAIVRDVVDLDGDVIEDTEDYYAQHEDTGDVWYLGEVAQNFEDGFLDNLDGSWRAGKDEALPGILIPADARPGRAYRQEFLLNEAEDIATVVSLGHTVRVPAGTFRNCLQTEESQPTEPGIRARKFYAPGIGSVLEIDDNGDRTELVQIIDR